MTPNLLRYLVALAGCCLLAGCDLRQARGPSASVGQRAEFPAGTVGAHVNGYRLSVPKVAAWYSMMREIALEVDSTHGDIDLNFTLDTSLSAETQRVRSIAPVRQVLERHAIPVEDFVILTTAVGLARMTLYLSDSIGPAAVPTNVNPAVLDFAKRNRRAFDSLEASMRAPDE